MRIKSINIAAFGSLKNFSLDFSEGFNVIYGHNENGKSTVMAFIKMMFYGSERGSAQISKNIRKKYTPWDSDVMAGSIDFEFEGKNYRLQREFRTSNATDKVTLTNLDMSTHQTVSPDVGREFFGMSAQAFERSIFIGQFGFPESDTAAEGEINARLSNIVTTGDESISFETVNKRIEKAKLALASKSGRAGEYDKNLMAAATLKESLKKATELQEKYAEGKKKISKYSQETEALIKQAEQLKKKISQEQDIRNAEKLKDLLSTKTELDLLNNSLRLKDGTLADTNYIRKLQFCISKVKSASQAEDAKKREIELVENNIQGMLNAPKDVSEKTKTELEEQIKLCEAQKDNIENEILNRRNILNDLKEKQSDTIGLKKKFNAALLSISGSFIAVSLVLWLAKLAAACLATAVIGAVFFVLSFLIKPIDRKKLDLLREEVSIQNQEINECMLKKSDINAQIASLNAKLEAVNLALCSNVTVLDTQKQLLENYKKELEVLQKETKSQQEALDGLLQGQGDFESIDVLIEELTENAEKQKELKQKLSFLINDLDGISYEAAAEKLAIAQNAGFENAENFDELKFNYDKLSAQISERKANEAAATAELKASVNSGEGPEHIKKKLKELTEKLTSQKEFCDVADIAMEVLLESFAELRKSYGSALEKRSAEIFSGLTDNRYKNMSISKSFDINVERSDAFGSKELAYLSSGTCDQAYLSLRLALTEQMTESGYSLPILLDDTLAQYDDLRADEAIKYLSDYAKRGQIIMFTCHKSLYDSAAQSGASAQKFN